LAQNLQAMKEDEGRVQTRSLAAEIHGRYLVRPAEGPSPGLLVGFHGYGETAEAHLEQLLRIPGQDRLVLVAVQSLHLFYTRAGDVVGSWMTKRDRERAIADNVRYVGAAVARVKEEFGAGGRLVYAGFSQGASMAYRAAARSGHACHGIIALGGDLPPDVADDPAVRLPPVLALRGDRDTWFTAEKLERDRDRLRALAASTQVSVFPGGHEWAEPVFPAAGAFLAEVLGRGAPTGG
jgi:predicted esterase